MQRNLSAEDRLFRLVLALTLFPLMFVLEGQARLFGLVGIVPLVVALFGWSPLYALCRVRGTQPATASVTADIAPIQPAVAS